MTARSDRMERSEHNKRSLKGASMRDIQRRRARRIQRMYIRLMQRELRGRGMVYAE